MPFSFAERSDSISADKPSGIRQKGESQNGCFKKGKHTKIPEKQIFLTPRFALLPYYRQTSFFPDIVLMLFSNLHKVIKPNI